MSGEPFRFFRAGGVDQVQLRTGRDLVRLKDLDQKLWVALSCPVAGLHLDERTLTLIDANKDGRVRAPELLAAIEWTAKHLKNPDEIGKPGPLPLDAIDDEVPEGKLILETARALLRSLDQPDATAISVEEVQTALDAFNKKPQNGDGIVPPSQITDSDLSALATTILAGVESPKTDRSGEPGITRDDIELFFSDALARLAWLQAGSASDIARLGSETGAAYEALQAVRAKIEDYFTRVHVAAFDARALAAMNRDEATFVALGTGTLSESQEELSSLPLAHITLTAELPLEEGVNPAWRARIRAFEEKVVRPLIGERTTLSEAEYQTIVEALTPYGEWLAGEPASRYRELPAVEFERAVEGGLKEKLLDIIASDEGASDQAGAIEDVEKLVRYKRDLLTLANNFVAFRDFYQPGKTAIFQQGTLYLDQRALTLVLRVNDAAKHAALAPLAATYLVYCDVKSVAGETMSIVAGVTNGDVDNLMVGRNGLFYDREGRDWDATITRIVDAPISVRQAFWSPYKKVIRLIEEQVNKRAVEAAAKSEGDVLSKATETEANIAEGKKPAGVEPPKKLDIGVVAALGVAVGGITAALGVFVQAFFGLGIWMPLGVLGLLLLISGPSMAVAWLKLRRRNIGPLLDANGWAVNVLPRINIALGNSFTTLASVPRGAPRDLVDPFADKKVHWGRWLFLIIVLGLALTWLLGKLDGFLPPSFQKATVLPNFPAAPVETPAEAPAPEAPAPEAPAAP